MKKHFLVHKRKSKKTFIDNKKELSKNFSKALKVVIICVSYLIAQLVIECNMVPKILVSIGFIEGSDNSSTKNSIVKENEIASNKVKRNDIVYVPRNYLKGNDSSYVPRSFLKADHVESKTYNKVNTQKKIKLFLIAKTGDSVSADEAYKRNQFLFNSLQMHQSIVANFEKAAIDSVNQARLFYITLMSALLAIIIIKKNKILGTIGMVVVIVMMYYLDVHYLDLEFRQHESVVTVSYTKDSLANISPHSTEYNNIDFSKLLIFTDSLDNTAGIRKRENFVNPKNIDQDILYMKPLLLVLWFLIYIFLIGIITVIKQKVGSLYNIK